MAIVKKRRRARSDSNYVIYAMHAESGHVYIGLTRKGKVTVSRAVVERWRKHVSRAVNEDKDWVVYEYLRNGGIDERWEYEVLEVIRGRAAAYARERVIVKEQRPTLNTQYIG